MADGEQQRRRFTPPTDPPSTGRLDPRRRFPRSLFQLKDPISQYPAPRLAKFSIITNWIVIPSAWSRARLDASARSSTSSAVAVYCVFFNDFGPHEHVFSPVRERP